MFSITRSRSRVENSRSRSRPNTGRLRNPANMDKKLEKRRKKLFIKSRAGPLMCYNLVLRSRNYLVLAPAPLSPLILAPAPAPVSALYYI